MVLFDQVVAILTLPEFTRSGKIACCFHFLESFWIGCIFIDRDDARSHGVGSLKRFREKTLHGLGIAGGVHGSIIRDVQRKEDHGACVYSDFGCEKKRPHMRGKQLLGLWYAGSG